MAQYGKEYTQGLQEQTPLLMQVNCLVFVVHLLPVMLAAVLCAGNDGNCAGRCSSSRTSGRERSKRRHGGGCTITRHVSKVSVRAAALAGLHADVELPMNNSDSTRPKRNPQVEERLALQQAHINGRRYAEDEIRSLRAAERNSHITDWQIEEQLRRGNRQRSADFKPAYGLPERDEAPPSAPPLEQPKNPGYAISDYSSVYDGEGGYKMEEYKSIYD